MMGSSLTSWKYLVDPRDNILKGCVDVFIRSVYLKNSDHPVTKTWRILEIMDELGRPQGSYHGSFLSILKY